MLLNVVHHVAIIVSDYEKSREFYVEKLELPIIRENYREERDDYKLDLQVGDIELEIFGVKNPPKRVTNPEACGLRHLAFKVDDIEEAVKWLNEKGIETGCAMADDCGICIFRYTPGRPAETEGRTDPDSCCGKF